MKRILFTTFMAAALPVSNAQEAQDNPIKSGVAADAQLNIQDITPSDAEKLIAGGKGVTILDVRTPEEFEDEHIKGAVNVNVFDKEFAKKVAALDQTRPIILHCAAGRRSAMALKSLTGKVSFPKIHHLTEGLNGWKEAGKPVETQVKPTERPAPEKK